MDTELIKIILAFVVLINPFSALGLFLSITNGCTTQDRKRVAQIACLTVLITICFYIAWREFAEVIRHLGGVVPSSWRCLSILDCH